MFVTQEPTTSLLPLPAAALPPGVPIPVPDPPEHSTSIGEPLAGVLASTGLAGIFLALRRRHA